MTFLNAYWGLKRVHTAEMLTLCSEILLLAASLLEFFVPDGRMTEHESVQRVFSTITAAGFILTIAAYVIEIFGFRLASKDEHNFTLATRFLLLPLGITALTAIIGQIVPQLRLEKVAQALQELMHVMVSVCALNGIRSIARKLSNEHMDKQGKMLLKFIYFSLTLSMLLTFASIALRDETVERISAALEALGLMLDSLVFVKILMYVHHSVQMIEERHYSAEKRA